jgi:YVTN family beta-propeller protein
MIPSGKWVQDWGLANFRKSDRTVFSLISLILVSVFFQTIILTTVWGMDEFHKSAETVSVSGESPSGIAYDPVHGRMYVTNLGSNTVSVIDTNSSMALNHSLQVGTSPQGIAYDPVHGRMYVTNFGSNTISVIDTNADTVIGNPIRVGLGPHGIAYDPVHGRMYVTMMDNKSVYMIDTNTNKVVGNPINISGSPKWIAYDPVHERMYVTNFGTEGNVSVIDTNTNVALNHSLQVGTSPQGIAYDPVHGRMYVTNFGSNTISIIDTNTTSVNDSYIEIERPFGISYDDATQRMYISNVRHDLIYMVDTNSNSIVGSPINVGSSPKGLAFDPVNNRIFVANSNGSSVSSIRVVPLEGGIVASVDGNGYNIGNGTATESNEITFLFNEARISSSSIQRYECSLNGSPFVKCGSPQSYNKLAEGTMHSFELRAVDEQGYKEKTPSLFTWQVAKPTSTSVEARGRDCFFEDKAGPSTTTMLPKLSFQETPLDGLTRGGETDELRINQEKLDCFTSGSSYSNGVGAGDPGSFETSGDRNTWTRDGNSIVRENNPDENEAPRTDRFDGIPDHISKDLNECNADRDLTSSLRHHVERNSQGCLDAGLGGLHDQQQVPDQLEQTFFSPAPSQQYNEQRINNITLGNLPMSLPF